MAGMLKRDTEVRLPRATKVKNKQAADKQVLTLYQISYFLDMVLTYSDAISLAKFCNHLLLQQDSFLAFSRRRSRIQSGDCLPFLSQCRGLLLLSKGLLW